jgi:hypothetical protein|tara:strand:- start:1369 stop:1731 length:363 start_codon:yes stop_codon:yes gene_type:complete
MATLITRLTLNSTTALSDTTSVSVTDTLAVTNPTELSRKSIATGSAQSVIASNSSFSYVYLKVISGVNATDWVQVLLGGDAKLKIRVGEFTFMPIYNAQAITAEAQGGACVVEYGYWTIA